ncbi:MAG: FAD binding domain-containing protein [bacterium]
MPITTHFCLNDQEIQTTTSPGTLVLDYLRHAKRMTGTKEGCKEGDCGACTVLIGELAIDRVCYNPVTSCLMPVGELHGKHLVTVEGLNMPVLTPVQQAIVDEGGTQCGFCTPGIVVSLTSLLMQENARIDSDSVKYALSGHLCRCTGYRSLKQTWHHLAKNIGNRTGIDALIEQSMLPAYFLEMPEKLHKIPKPLETNGAISKATAIAGGTDIYVQKGEELPDTPVNVLNLYPEMRHISKRDNDFLQVGALTTFEEFTQHPEVLKIIPRIQDYTFLIASWQIRNRATLGGNIINASPIGDMTMLLLAMESLLVLKDGKKTRKVPMTAFYKGYKQLDKSSNEILTHINIPLLEFGAKINFEKVSKRKCLDIASVNSAIKIREKNSVITKIGLAMGGVAPEPLFMRKTCSYFVGKKITTSTVLRGIDVAQQEISPISDIRGSADYKRLLTRQLVIAHFTKLFPEYLRIQDFLTNHKA